MSPPPPWHALAEHVQRWHPEWVALFMALSEARWQSGGRGGGQGVFYDCRDRLRKQLANEWVTVLTRLWAAWHPSKPLYKFRRSWLDGELATDNGFHGTKENGPGVSAPQAVCSFRGEETIR